MARVQPVPDALFRLPPARVFRKRNNQRPALVSTNETIEAGGEELTKSEGDIGKLSFSAAAGISDLSQHAGTGKSRANRELYLKAGQQNPDSRALKLAMAESGPADQKEALTISALAFRDLGVWRRTNARGRRGNVAQASPSFHFGKFVLETILEAIRWRQSGKALSGSV